MIYQVISSDEKSNIDLPDGISGQKFNHKRKSDGDAVAFALNCISIILVYTRYFGIEKNADKERIFVIYNSIAP